MSTQHLPKSAEWKPPCRHYGQANKRLVSIDHNSHLDARATTRYQREALAAAGVECMLRLGEGSELIEWLVIRRPVFVRYLGCRQRSDPKFGGEE